MAVSIDELQVETQGPAAHSGAPATGAAKQQPQQKPDMKAEMDRLRERDLRLKAD
jgi:hypothetical protein